MVERAKANGAGSFDRYALLYSTTGEPVAQLAANGRPVERYAQSALGERKVYVDAERPAPTQVSAKPNGIRIELSEQVQEPEEASGPSAVLRAQAQGFTLTEVATGAPIDIEAKLAPEPGPGLERRRLEISVPNPPPAGTQVRLSLSPEALEDFFANRPDDMSEWTFAWPSAGISIIEDTAPPELVRALLKDGKVEATFSKEVTEAGLGDAASIDNASVEWTVSPDGRVATTSTVLPGGIHRVEFGAGPIDLAGKGLASPIAVELTVPTGERRDLAGLVVLLFELLNQRELAQSPTGQQASFQGHPVDPETGFVYLRNRYFDPELGRFITADPMGYPDGPSEYAFGAGDVVNGRDPMGLETLMMSTTGESRVIDGRQLAAMLVAEGLHPREADRIVIEAGMGDEINAHIVAGMAPTIRAAGKFINTAMVSTATAYGLGIGAVYLAPALPEITFALRHPFTAGAGACLTNPQACQELAGDLAYTAMGGQGPINPAAVPRPRFDLPSPGLGPLKADVVEELVGGVPARAAGWYEEVAVNATRNPGSDRLVLGHFSTNGTSYQNVAAHYKATYFKVEDWNAVTMGLSQDEIWRINETFLVQQIRQGKQILLSHDPLKARAGSFFSREVDFLRELGYIFKQKNQWTWVAVR